MEDNKAYVPDPSGRKDLFVKLLKDTKRMGMDELLAWIDEKTDFFTAPASTKFQEAYEGGLLEHSLNVLAHMRRIGKVYNTSPYSGTVTIVSLLHDLCKANFYSVEMRNRKDENGRWVKVPFYIVDDKCPIGHGEKSVILLQRFIPLTMEEILAINWHMGFSDIRAHEFSGINQLGTAYSMCQLAVQLHIADLAATYLK